MYWIGPEAAIIAAEQLAAAEVVGKPEYQDGSRVPRREWVTARWAEPMLTAKPDVWAIPAYEGIEPDNVELVEHVDWPEDDATPTT